MVFYIENALWGPVSGFEPSLFEPRVVRLVKMNRDCARTGKSVQPKRGVRAYQVQASEV